MIAFEVYQLVNPGETVMKPSNQAKLPKQVAPVQRPSTSVALSHEQGVEASLASNMWNLMRLYA